MKIKITQNFTTQISSDYIYFLYFPVFKCIYLSEEGTLTIYLILYSAFSININPWAIFHVSEYF